MVGGSGKRGGSDRVLESRHLVGLFLGVVLLCGVFFTLGYVMGRTQYGLPMPLRAAAASNRDTAIPPTTARPDPSEKPPANGEWDFYSKEKDPNKLEPPAPAPAAAPAGHAASSHPAETRIAAPATKPVSANGQELRRFQPPRIPHGSVVLQITALTKEADALAEADAVQQKHFPSFVVTPTTDNLYRVQVGPYADQAAAQRAQKSLDQAGFNSIIKR
ncbi:MAG: SPOR domain-containing protein [Candidatus Acidiferrales bacterium]